MTILLESSPQSHSHSRRTEVEDEQCTDTNLATNAPAATRPVCWLAIRSKDSTQPFTWGLQGPFIGLDTTAPTPPHSGKHGAHARTSWRPGFFTERGQRTPRKKRPPSSSVSQVALPTLPL
jgi:hypothetical protein